MKSTTLHIKNMVCDRCIRTVRTELEQAGFLIDRVELGEADLEMKSSDLKQVRDILQRNGFDLLEDKKVQLIEQIKNVIIELVQKGGLKNLSLNFSEYLSRKLEKDYHYLSILFSQTEAMTIEKYLIVQKIERAKELLIYGELSLSEIARELGYGSVQYLSTQFKQTTGFTPRDFKKLKWYSRQSLDNVR